MNPAEAIEWLKGNRNTAQMLHKQGDDSHILMAAQADAARIQQAYYILKAHKEGLV